MFFLVQGLLLLVSAFDCDGRKVDARLMHVHVQDFSSSFDDHNEALSSALQNTSSYLYSEFGNGNYQFHLVDGTDKAKAYEEVTSKGCNFSHFSKTYDQDDLQDFNTQIDGIIMNDNNYWDNHQRPDLVDAIYDTCSLDLSQEGAPWMLIFTVATDQCPSESCYHPTEDPFGSIGCSHDQIDPDVTREWEAGINRKMDLGDCENADYPTLTELGGMMHSKQAKVLWLVGANDSEPCQDSVGKGVHQYYEERFNPALASQGVVSTKVNVDSHNIKDKFIEEMEKIICAVPPTPHAFIPADGAVESGIGVGTIVGCAIAVAVGSGLCAAALVYYIYAPAKADLGKTGIDTGFEDQLY